MIGILMYVFPVLRRLELCSTFLSIQGLVVIITWLPLLTNYVSSRFFPVFLIIVHGFLLCCLPDNYWLDVLRNLYINLYFIFVWREYKLSLALWALQTILLDSIDCPPHPLSQALQRLGQNFPQMPISFPLLLCSLVIGNIFLLKHELCAL
jgi:hypothetical protein